jgi:hypothetical protein
MTTAASTAMYTQPDSLTNISSALPLMTAFGVHRRYQSIASHTSPPTAIASNTKLFHS